MSKHSKAFTLLEILLVVAAVGLLAAIVFVAINPNEQLGKVRDTERQSEVDTLHDAIRQYSTDNGGTYPSAIAEMSNAEAKEICADGVSDEACINLTDDLTPEYIAEVPSGPQTEGPGSGYVVSKQDTRVRISAQNVEERSELITAGYSSNKLLDEKPFATLAYSTRLLREGHVTETRQSGTTAAGSYLVRVRQDNANNDTADVLPDGNGELSANSNVQNTTNSSDGQTLDTWVGSNNAYVTTWYDQSTENNQATQTTQSSQPQIVSNGSLIQSAGSVTPDFDGSDDYVDTGVTDNLQTGNFSVSAWMYLSDISATESRIVADDNNNDNGWALSYGDGGQEGVLRFFMRGMDNISLDTGNAVNEKTWHHVVGVFDNANNNRFIYIDGNVEASLTNDSGSPDTDSGTMLVGAKPKAGQYFPGNIEDVTMYKRVLSAGEVTKLYNRGR
ncbi:MAG: hypothetical protein BRC23_02615 [Parcubacteria group bacterium SW_4_49_11]|nr:MAG: hypothetical protein BRC23_02615 [Parcubacteria group bacterium SW_4_49_11]